MTSADSIPTGDLRQIDRVAAPVREQVVHMLRNAILSAELTPGQRVIEREICEATGASRTAVREALRQLESEGLITMRAQRGPTVSVISEKEAVSLYATRSVLEALVVRECVEHGTDDDLAILGEAFDHVRQAATTGDPASMHEPAVELYERLFDCADNSVAEHILRLLYARARLLRSTLSTPSRLQEMADELQVIARAIERRDAVAAEAASRRHVLNAGKAAVQLLKDENQGAS